jgi:hypothetical protein
MRIQIENTANGMKQSTMSLGISVGFSMQYCSYVTERFTFVVVFESALSAANHVQLEIGIGLISDRSQMIHYPDPSFGNYNISNSSFIQFRQRPLHDDDIQTFGLMCLMDKHVAAKRLRSGIRTIYHTGLPCCLETRSRCTDTLYNLLPHFAEVDAYIDHTTLQRVAANYDGRAFLRTPLLTASGSGLGLLSHIGGPLISLFIH